MSEKNKPEHVKNVGCIVKDCRFHSDADRCHAEHITVSNAEAQNKAETFCSTFEQKESF